MSAHQLPPLPPDDPDARYALEHTTDPDTFTELRDDPEAVRDAVHTYAVHKAMDCFAGDFDRFITKLLQPPFRP